MSNRHVRVVAQGVNVEARDDGCVDVQLLNPDMAKLGLAEVLEEGKEKITALHRYNSTLENQVYDLKGKVDGLVEMKNGLHKTIAHLNARLSAYDSFHPTPNTLLMEKEIRQLEGEPKAMVSGPNWDLAEARRRIHDLLAEQKAARKWLGTTL